jgi:RNA recognition motif-containing protein
MKIYIANLDTAIDNERLRLLFEPYGTVLSAELVMDIVTDTSRGFGYVEMEDDDARLAIKELNQTVLHTLTLTVEEAPQNKEKPGFYQMA